MNISEILKLALAYLGPIITLFIFHKTVGNTKEKERSDCIEKIKLDITHHGLDQTKFQLNHEKLADSVGERFKHLENKVNQFDNIVPEVQALKLKMEHYTVKIDNLIESIKESKNEQKEAYRDLKDLFKSQHHNG